MFFLLHQPHHAKLCSASPVQLGVNLHTFRKKNSYKRTFSRLHFMQLPPARASRHFSRRTNVGARLDVLTHPGQFPGWGAPGSAWAWPTTCKRGTPPFCHFYHSLKRYRQREEKMSMPSGLTDQVASSMQPWSPALAGPTLISWTIFLAIRLGSCVQCCPVWWPLSIWGCWALVKHG